MTWKRWDHPAGYQLLLIASFEVSMALILLGTDTQPGVMAGLWRALGL